MRYSALGHTAVGGRYLLVCEGRVNSAPKRSSHAFRMNPEITRNKLRQAKVGGMDVGKDPLNTRWLQPIQVLEQTRKHRAIIGQHRIVAVLKQRRLFDLDLLARDTSTIDAATHHPVDAAVTVIGAAVAVLAEGTAEFGDHDDDGVAPT